MTSVTAVLDKDKKPQYKEYVNFLDNYKSGKRNDCDFTSSSSSITSDVSDVNEMPTKSFKEYLQDYNNKKYQPVQPNFVKKIEEGKNVKTEVFIQINNTTNNKGNEIKITIPKPKIDDTDGEQQTKVSVGRLSQKFNNNPTKINCIKRSSSITEKTKLFEEKTEEISNIPNINKRNVLEKFPKNGMGPTKKTNGHRQNQTFVEIRKQELQNNNRLNGSVSPPQLPIGNNNIKSEIIRNTTPEIEPIGIDGNITIDPPIEVIKLEVNKTNCAIPPPPPLPPVNLPPKPFNSNPKTTYVNNTSSKSVNTNLKPTSVQSTGFNATPKVSNGFSTLPKTQNNKNDTTETTTIDRNDPRVKKMVYGALRGMYGSYHDKANDYLATLPKNRVKKGNGLDSIINSIAAQGGLEKLSGRGNPKSETEQI